MEPVFTYTQPNFVSKAAADKAYKEAYNNRIFR